MAKREHKIVAFHGGFNDNSDPKDIRDEELREADGVSSSRVGRLVGVGNIGSSVESTLNDFTNTLKQGCGLYFFSTDVDSEESLGGEDWLAIYDSANNSNVIKLYYRDKSKLVGNDSQYNPGFFTSAAISFGTNNDKAIPSFYLADGGLRISDASFKANSKLHMFIDSNLFQKSATVTDEILLINKWVNVEQELKSFDDLNVTLDTFDAGAAGPGSSQITAVNLSNAGRIVLAYWTDSDGDWNGTYQFAATPIYKGEQEGGLSIISDTLNFYDNQVVFQVYICTGTSSSLSDDSDHPLQDDRIIGINWYFRSGADDDWIFLQKTDLLEGGQHYWKQYNSSTETSYGYFDGTISIKDSNDDITLGNTTGSSGDKTAPSYDTTTLTATVTNSNTNGFTGRYGFLRVWGGHTSPVWLNSKTDGSPIDLASASYSVPIVTPGDGGREFKVDLLDENFTVVKESDKVTITITDSGQEPPPLYEEERSG
jgi:hypothetical protein